MSTRTLMLGLFSRFASKSPQKLSQNSAAAKCFFVHVSDQTFQSLPSVHLFCKRCKSTRDFSDEFDHDWNDDFQDERNSLSQRRSETKWRGFDDLVPESEDSRQPTRRSQRDDVFIGDFPSKQDQDDFEPNQDFHARQPSYRKDTEDSFNWQPPTRKHKFRNFDREKVENSFPERDFGYSRSKSFSNDSGDSGGQYDLDDIFDNLSTRAKDFSKQEPIKKDLYTEHEDVTNRPQKEIDEFLEKNQITIIGQNQKRPILKFEESGLSEKICKLFRKLDFTEPSVIQSIGWPHALSGNDVVGIAQTGSGKTLSFILPAILHIQAQKAEKNVNGPLALVLCPTRELAVQCQKVAEAFRRVCNLRSAAVFGGAKKHSQIDALQNPDLDMVVATPGRLLDFLNSGHLDIAQCSYVVLDEADRMLDMGFEPQIRSILQQIRPDRQMLMWSATWPEEIQELATDFLKDFVHIQIGAHGQMVNSDITHEFVTSTGPDKLNMLIDHLAGNPDSKNPKIPAKTLVFSDTKKGCSYLEFKLRKAGFTVGSLHGDKSQSQRDMTMLKFRTGMYPVIVASDVAARGLDVTDIEYVINYDLPKNIDSYIHRVGRTARAGKKGTAISYITREDVGMAGKLIKLLKDVGHEIPEILIRIERARLNPKSRSRNSRGRRY